ncbi:hypothetical protein [uncultured Methylobacterium sp.]|uniref:hypothetical protein n=1 Tax=uncultured Methylobacterium sp. TaxID=157278 RepID=UPI0035CB5F0A
MDKAKKAALALAAMLDRFYALIAAIVLGILGLVGIAPRPTAAGLAQAVLDQEPPPTPEAAAEEEATPDLGWLVKDHAAQRVGRRPVGMPALAPLPAVVAAWLDGQDPVQLRRLAGHDLAARLIQQHVLSGTGGCLPSLGYVLKPTRSTPQAHVHRAGEGSAGKGSMRVDLNDVLQDLGYAPAGPRFR